MTVRLKPWSIDGNTHPSNDARIAVASIVGSDLTASFAGGVGAVDSGHGVTGPTDLKVTQNGTPNMSVLVAAGSALIRGTQSALQGVYSASNDASLNVSISAANATNPRRDLIILQVRDANYSGADRDARITVVTGTPAASPVDPSLSSFPNALVLARVAVAANATSITNANITDLRLAAGGWNQPRGALVNRMLSTSQTGISGGTDITGSSVTGTTEANRLIKVSAKLPVRQRTAPGAAILYVVYNGSILDSSGFVSLGTDEYGSLVVPGVTYVSTAGSHTWKLQVATASGTVDTQLSSTSLGTLIVEDIDGTLV